MKPKAKDDLIMYRLAYILILCGFLVSCSENSWYGDNPPTPLHGERIDILIQQEPLKVDVEKEASIVLPPPKNVDEWPQVGGFPSHTMSHLSIRDNLQRVWSANIGAGASKKHVFLTQPVVAKGKVFAMDSESVASAYDLKNGKLLWETDLTRKDINDGSYGGGIAFDNDKLFITSQFAELLAINSVDGNILWRRSLVSPVRGAPTVIAGRVLLMTVDNLTLCLSSDDGHELWRHVGIDEMTSIIGGNSPAVYEDFVVVSYKSGEVLALNLENGSVKWNEIISVLKGTNQATALTDIRGLPIIDNDRVFVINNSDVFMAIDLHTGRRIWEKNVGSMQTPWVADNYVYLINKNSELICFEADTGQVHWIKNLNFSEKKPHLAWSGPLLASNKLITVSSSGNVVFLSPYTGEVLEQKELPTGVTIAPIIANETLLFMTKNGELIAYR
ncbi:MAG: PQQ-binding-like beta-propeller repeat protein [Rhodospirillaceae bacterium]|jgi:outer membrane protein assembly factor BamB|nr:PQQ-binding-like beta-propeller repeat protein [Rhodospirillaceae bacterium]